jgi:HTH-type transcriptional regulator, transcriptional repressor of NAD biosynthesis genes
LACGSGYAVAVAVAAAGAVVTARFRTGLVVGKLSPLHHGHEHLLTTALGQCERVLCLSYSSPELPGCGAATRRRWMAELFPAITHLGLDESELGRLRQTHPKLPHLPDNDASELEQRVFVAELCLRVFGVAVDAVFTSELYGDGFAAELQRQFRAAGNVDAHVEHVLVDLARIAVPISATAIRADRELGLTFLSPVVRASFVRRVCLVGGESSGKTTLTRALAASFETTHCEEYGRELWLERGGELRYDDYLRIATTQLQLEEEASRAARHVTFCDTSPLTTLFYCLDQFGHAEPELHRLADRAYDLFLLCAPDLPFEQDGTRRDPAFRARQHDFYLAELERLQARWILVHGSVEARVESARSGILSL